MDDPPKKPPRSPIPTPRDLWEDITGSHSVESDPPGARWLDRRVGRAVRLAVRWVITTKGGTALVAAISAFLTWLSHKLTHWMGP